MSSKGALSSTDVRSVQAVAGTKDMPGTKTVPEVQAVPGLKAALAEKLGHAWQLWRDFTGESAYDHYVYRHQLDHPDHPPMTPREFWRAKADYDETHVEGSCC